MSNIDYVTMRKETEIPVGDLFTVMESWDDGDRIKRVASASLLLTLAGRPGARLQGMHPWAGPAVQMRRVPRRARCPTLPHS